LIANVGVGLTRLRQEARDKTSSKGTRRKRREMEGWRETRSKRKEEGNEKKRRRT
jgi:hypothetical protein